MKSITFLALASAAAAIEVQSQAQAPKPTVYGVFDEMNGAMAPNDVHWSDVMLWVQGKTKQGLTEQDKIDLRAPASLDWNEFAAVMEDFVGPSPNTQKKCIEDRAKEKYKTNSPTAEQIDKVFKGAI